MAATPTPPYARSGASWPGRPWRATARFVGEFFRQPDAHLGFLFAGATMGQLLSVPMILVGAWLMLRAKGEAETLAGAEAVGPEGPPPPRARNARVAIRAE